MGEVVDSRCLAQYLVVVPVLVFVVNTAISSTHTYAAEVRFSAPQQRAGSDQAGVTLALENADIRELARWASSIIDKSIILHPNVKGQVTVIAGEPLSAGEAYELFMSVLHVHGFAAVETKESIKVIPAELATSGDIPFVAEGLTSEGHFEDIVVQVLRVENIQVDQLVTSIRPLLSKAAHLAAYPQNNTLILADRAGNIAKTIRLIREIDLVGVIDIDLIPLAYADAQQVVEILNRLLQMSLRSKKGGSTFNFTADERTNSILLSGDQVTRHQVRNLIERLDQPTSGEDSTQVIYVDYITATEVADILRGIVSGDPQSKGKKPFDAGKVNIQVSETNNALIITAPGALQKSLKRVVSELDVPRQQVLVEAIIVEVNDELADDIGVEWRTNVPGDEGVFGGIGLLPGLPVFEIPEIGAGATLGYFRGGDLRALLRALETRSGANILSTPSIMTLDNEPAEILVGSNVPFITGQSTGTASSTDNPFQTIERQDVGVTLRIVPRINNADSVTLEVEQTVESITNSIVETADIVTNKRNIKTRVLVENNQVVVLGGLIQDDVQQTISRVPLLGSIPGLKRVFSSTRSDVIKKNLMIFIRPIILASRAQTDIKTLDTYDRMRGLQQRFNQKDTDKLFVPKQPPILPELDIESMEYEVDFPVDES